MKPARALAPSEINQRRRRAPQHVQAALDEASPLVEINHERLTRLREELPPDSPLLLIVLEILADNARIGKVLTDAQLGG